ncbi:MAG: SIS domain-containing protein [Anaerolineales bacterium]|nr:SIS domain-containing protein [Anaerolineales bacterium]
MEKGQYTRTEIFSQPEAWSAALEVLTENRRAALDLQPARRYSQIIYTGCGSTYYLALAAAALTQELTGLPARAFPASELWLSPRSSYVDGKTLLVAVSRSGETTETLRACEAFLAGKRGELVTLFCYGGMPLAKMGALNIVLPSGQEQSVAQTRAFSTLYLGTAALACLWAGREDLFASLSKLPEAGRRLLKNYALLAAELGRDASIDRFYWLGSGPRYGQAGELSLKMKEMSLSHSEPFHFMEFRHGPKSMVTPSALVVGLRSSVNAAQESAVLADVKALGGRVLTVGEEQADVQFESGVGEAIRNVLYLPVGQLIAFERSLSKGLNPDQPNNLDSVVKLS